jgi:hypothetical protein
MNQLLLERKEVNEIFFDSYFSSLTRRHIGAARTRDTSPANQIQTMLPGKFNCCLPEILRQHGPMRMAAAELPKLALQLRDWLGKRRSSLMPHYQPSLAADST